MAERGAPKKYTANQLQKAVNKYFASITRQRALTEPVATGEMDKYGHPIFRDQPVLNGLGKQVEVTEYLVAPSKGDLAIALKIHRSTWDNWHDEKKYPEFKDIVAWADDRFHAWNEQQVLTRNGRDVKGIIWNLDNNYGYNRKREAQEKDEDDRPHGIILMPTVEILEPPEDDDE